MRDISKMFPGKMFPAVLNYRQDNAIRLEEEVYQANHRTQVRTSVTDFFVVDNFQVGDWVRFWMVTPSR